MLCGFNIIAGRKFIAVFANGVNTFLWKDETVLETCNSSELTQLILN